jgi:polyhydroxybutyrate depolymerase
MITRPLRSNAPRLVALVLVALIGTSCGRLRDIGSTTTTTTPGGGSVPASYDPYAGTKPAAAKTRPSTYREFRTADGRTRSYRLFVPASLPAGTPAPLLIALHGGLGNSEQFEVNSGFDGLAEANGFVVVYPDGIGAVTDSRGPQTWNGGYCCGKAVERNVDDVGFVRQLIGVVRSQVAVDPTRVFAAGHSNGAILAYRLACELSDVIVAIGVQAGSLGVDSCTPSRPVSVFHLHGTADTNHPIGGGSGDGLSGVVFRPARAAVEALASLDGCAATPTVETPASDRALTVSTWSSCSSGTAVRFVAVDGATHAWMGHEPYSKAGSSFVGEPYRDLDASRAIWSFLAAHPRPG